MEVIGFAGGGSVGAVKKVGGVRMGKQDDGDGDDGREGDRGRLSTRKLGDGATTGRRGELPSV